MGTLIYSEGLLEPEETLEDFHDVVTAVNNAASAGNLFFSMQDEAGTPVAFDLSSIRKIKGC